MSEIRWPRVRQYWVAVILDEDAPEPSELEIAKALTTHPSVCGATATCEELRHSDGAT